MNSISANIIKAVTQFRELYKQTGLLLETADEQMVSHNWEKRGSQCVSGSNALKNPTEWLPTFIFRLYNGKRNRKNLVSFVSVFLSDPGTDAEGPVTEPLVSAGWYEYADRRKAPKGIDGWWWPTYHLEHANRSDDGKVITTTDNTWLEPEKWGVGRFSSLALPLVSIQNPNDLLERVIEPVLDHIESLRPSR